MNIGPNLFTISKNMDGHGWVVRITSERYNYVFNNLSRLTPDRTYLIITTHRGFVFSPRKIGEPIYKTVLREANSLLLAMPVNLCL